MYYSQKSNSKKKNTAGGLCRPAHLALRMVKPQDCNKCEASLGYIETQPQNKTKTTASQSSRRDEVMVRAETTCVKGADED